MFGVDACNLKIPHFQTRKEYNCTYRDLKVHGYYSFKIRWEQHHFVIFCEINGEEKKLSLQPYDCQCELQCVSKHRMG